MSTTANANHEDYADEARAAECAEDWSEAAGFWRRAANDCPDANASNEYRGQAMRCDGEIAADRTLADIARKVMSIPTLDPQNADGLDFHEVAVWNLREMLRLAYRAGRASR